MLERVAQLEAALDSRIPIEQANGILALTFCVSPDEVFEVLLKAARDQGTELRDLAQRVVAEAILAEAIHKAGPGIAV